MSQHDQEPQGPGNEYGDGAVPDEMPQQSPIQAPGHPAQPYEEHVTATVGPYPLGTSPVSDIDDIVPDTLEHTDTVLSESNTHQDLNHRYDESGRYEFEGDVWMAWHQYGLNGNGQHDPTDPNRYEIQFRFWSTSDDTDFLHDIQDQVTEQLVDSYLDQNSTSPGYQ